MENTEFVQLFISSVNVACVVDHDGFLYELNTIRASSVLVPASKSSPTVVQKNSSAWLLRNTTFKMGLNSKHSYSTLKMPNETWKSRTVIDNCNREFMIESITAYQKHKNKNGQKYHTRQCT